MHGKTSPIHHDGRPLFAGLAEPVHATRYHSLIVERATLPDDARGHRLDATDDVIMGVRHRELPVEGVQFHPESILTARGQGLLANFLARCADDAA